MALQRLNALEQLICNQRASKGPKGKTEMDSRKAPKPTAAKQARTPGPWRVLHTPESSHQAYVIAGPKYRIANMYDDEAGDVDAAFIVKACNAHDELMAALKQIASIGEDECTRIARAALAKAVKS